MATSTSHDSDFDPLIFELAASLEPYQRAAFEDAARAVVAALPYLGPGVVYRALKPLQREFFNPPADERLAYGPRRQFRGNKLSNAPPIGADDPRVGGRDRHRLIRV
jgi:hypothetical protein